LVAAESAAGRWVPNSDFGSHRWAALSRRLAARGWIGMTWPRRCGGHERSMLERYVVTEELLAAGAPVGSHWIVDRQSAPLLLCYGTEDQRLAFLPGIAKGEIFFSIDRITGSRQWNDFSHGLDPLGPFPLVWWLWPFAVMPDGSAGATGNTLKSQGQPLHMRRFVV